MLFVRSRIGTSQNLSYSIVFLRAIQTENRITTALFQFAPKQLKFLYMKHRIWGFVIPCFKF